MEKIAFEIWLEQLDTVATNDGHEGSLVDQTGDDCWKEYYEEGLSPVDAYAEDLKHV